MRYGAGKTAVWSPSPLSDLRRGDPSMLAARRLRRAEAVIGAARSIATLLAIAPARPLIVRGDGAIEPDPILLREIGAKAAGEAGRFRRPIAASTQPTGRVRRCRRCRLSGRRSSARCGSRDRAGCSMCAAGRRLRPEPAGTLLLWLFDISDAEAERAKLTRRLQQTEGALDALTHLIESAPFPMWYRGPDLSLGLVNGAFVAAVEGRDAAEVIERGSELIDARGRGQRPRRRRDRTGNRPSPIRAPSRRRSAASGACCGSSTCRCRPARWPDSRSTSRTWRMRGSSLRATSNRSASWPTG